MMKATLNKTSDKNILNIRENQNRKIEQGLCQSCGSPQLKYHNSWCFDCWLKQKSYQVLGDRSRWGELKQMLEDAEYKCHYTGVELIPALNLSFDHKKSRSVYPEEQGNIDNVVPSDWIVNCYKHAKSYDQFNNELKMENRLGLIIESSYKNLVKKIPQ